MRHTKSLPKRRFRRVGLTIVVSLSLAACGGVRINTDYDPQASFDNTGRYDWADSTDVMGENSVGGPFLERRIIRAVDHTLSEHGFVQDTVGEVDFIVTAFVMEPAPPDFRSVSGGPAVSVSFGVGFGHPWAHGIGYPWSWYRYPYVTRPWGFGYGPGAYSVGFGYTWMPQQGLSSGSSPGTLVVDVFDGTTGELIWRGWAEGALREAAYTDDVQEYLNQTVAKILKGFPPESQSSSP